MRVVRERENNWINNKIKRELIRHDQLFKSWLKNPSIRGESLKYKTQWNRFKNLMRQRKNEYIQSSFDNCRDLKSFHRQLNLTTGKSTNALYPSFTETTNIYTFKEFYVNVGPNMHEVIPSGGPIKLKSEVQSMFLEPTNEIEIATVMNKLENKTSAGPYGISNKFLKLAAPAIVAPLNILINSCFSESYFPDILKLAKVIPVYKNDDPNDFPNYRPISGVPHWKS